MDEILESYQYSGSKNWYTCNRELYLAAKTGDIECISKCIRNGTDLNCLMVANNYTQEEWDTLLHPDWVLQTTPLIEAIRGRYIDCIKLLLETGADPNLEDSEGISPIFYVFSEDILALLVKYGAKINNTYGYETPLMAAMKYSDFEYLKALIKYGADVNAKSDYGTTALYSACIENNVDIAKFLLENGADMQILCENETPCDYVYKHNYTEMIELFAAFKLKNVKGCR